MRARFAPSPTGFLHIGNVRTALFNYLLASKNKGSFILRIEDTDKDRSKDEYIENIYEDLRWLGIVWDEGPDIGGQYGPYRQSERLSSHKEYVQKLIDQGDAYYCYCSHEELETRRKEQVAQGLTPHYDNCCRDLTAAQVAVKKQSGVLPSVRFKVQDEGTIIVDDAIRGEVAFDVSLIGDFVIMRPDGSPTFHLAVAVDDGMMEITHVLRGEDHLTNTPKHIMIMKACGFKIPRYAHMALTMGPGGEPLSKRFGAMSIREYRNAGYRSEALCNYMALLGWSTGDDRELFSFTELQELFSLNRVAKSPAVFDKTKLDWVSGMHMRDLDDQAFVSEAVAFVLREKIVREDDFNNRPEWFAKVLLVFKPYISCFSELKEQLRLFDDEITYEDEGMLVTDEAQNVLVACRDALCHVDSLDENNFQDVLKEVKKESKQKGKALFAPLRISITGQMHGPDLQQIMILLGKKGCLQRLEKVIKD